MKQCYKLLLSLTVIAFWATGCKETDEEVINDTLLLSTNSIAVAVQGDSRTIAVTSSGAWEATSQAKWITLTPTENQLTVTVDANAGVLRTGEITITTATLQQIISVRQESLTGTSALKIYYDRDKCMMDSEGAEFTATVIASSDWNATIDNAYFTLHVDQAANRFSVTAPANQAQAQQAATVSITSAETTERIYIAQQTRNENRYFSLTGSWGWTAEKWYFAGNFSGTGTHTAFRLEELVYNTTYTLRDLFIKGGGMYVTYFPGKHEVHVPLGTSIGATSSYLFYLCACRIEGNSFGLTFEGGLTFTQSGNGMKVTGSNSEVYPYVGIFAYDGMSFKPFTDLYYAQTEGSMLSRAAASSVVLSPVFSDITPNLGTIPRMRGFATATMEKQLK